jgi:hypothetical protein
MGPLILIAALLAVEAPQFQVDSIDGTTVAGTLVRLDAQQVVVHDSSGDHALKLSEVRFVGAVENQATNSSAGSVLSDKSTANASKSKPPEPPTVVVETVDGGRLFGFGYEVTKGTARLKLVGGDSIAVPTKSIHRVEFISASKPVVWPELPKDAAGDLIILQKKDAVDLAEGIVGDITADTVRFSLEGDVIPVKRTRVVGLVYFHSGQAASPSHALAIVENKAGWKVNATQVDLAAGHLSVVTTFGVTLDWPLEAVRSIDFSPSRMVYVSDLPLNSAEWTPLLDFGKQIDAISQFYKPRFDRALDGGKLSIDSKTYRKGVAIAARTVLEYKIAGLGRQFRATAGIDDSVHATGGVQLTIEGDGKNLYSGKISGRGAPVDLNLDVSGVKLLRIVADFGGGADVGDYLDLGDARIVK